MRRVLGVSRQHNGPRQRRVPHAGVRVAHTAENGHGCSDGRGLRTVERAAGHHDVGRRQRAQRARAVLCSCPAEGPDMRLPAAREGGVTGGRDTWGGAARGGAAYQERDRGRGVAKIGRQHCEQRTGPPRLRPGVVEVTKGAQGPRTPESGSCSVWRRMAARQTSGWVRSAAEDMQGRAVVRDAQRSRAGREHQWPAASPSARGTGTSHA